jgi:ubiquinone/menaquinone biosynthesis C-methylase UbiE
MTGIEPLFWSLQSYIWDDYLQFPECCEEIRVTAAWLAEYLPAGGRVLDVGCGTGNHALALAGLGCCVVGVDYSAGMLRRARAKAARLPQARLEFRQVDLNHGLPFPAGAFDGAIAVAVLQCVVDPGALLHALRCVLRSRGVFLLVALDPAQRAVAKRKPRTTPTRWVIRQVKALGNRSRRVQRYSQAELLGLLDLAGFDLSEERAAPGTIGLLCRADRQPCLDEPSLRRRPGPIGE